MPGSWTTLNVKDAAGTTRNMRAWDESGTGVGPFSFGQVLADGLGGAVTVTAGALSVSSSGGVSSSNYVSGAITTAMTATTSTSLLAAPAAGLRNYITQITVSNSHATVGTDVLIQDGSGGATLYVIPAAAVYGGAAVSFPTPLRQPTTATALYAQNVTTGASVKVSASGYKAS
jgi:hypothetical protein